jgi:hypothetical protein
LFTGLVEPVTDTGPGTGPRRTAGHPSGLDLLTEQSLARNL